ncbi:hypothetical protein HO173_006612 [Letharia columbiana]|uniref:Uncharacterized protein n=1 Tax=Letharia columbiana TaxID=112416 RepID=A0A8H6FVB9_9LECA|nr:uncharacterized protein HO173_006612 [Letharia columbiana]KAF6235416.1 hypothetical protein HO173_006612 [Letharia columbiana]
MALTRSFTFPLSHTEESSRTPPFSLNHEDVGRLLSCRAFQAIRGFLTSRHGDSFCLHHQPTSKAHEEAWLLQRDITYALILPLLEIQRYATQLAISMLGDRNIFDLELVFRGEARGAFAWLQCFIAEEEEWCSVQGCPACVVSHVLEAEPTIRIIVTACRLASSLRRVSDPTPGEDPSSLPVFDFWLSSLRTALDEDPFWGPDIWKELEPRASNLENGLHQMVRQCIEFEEMQATKTVRQPELAPISASVGAAVLPAKLATYRSDGKRMVFIGEESSWMQKIVLGCLTTLLADMANVGRTPGVAATLHATAVISPLSQPLSS